MKDEFLASGVQRFADWLMTERFDHDGVMGWSYQHDFNGGRNHYQPSSNEYQILPGPQLWHHESLGRLLTYCALRFETPEYFEAWAQSTPVKTPGTDHSVSAILQFITWVQAKLWQAKLSEAGIVAQPSDFGKSTPDKGEIMTPDGIVQRSLAGSS